MTIRAPNSLLWKMKYFESLGTKNRHQELGFLFPSSLKQLDFFSPNLSQFRFQIPFVHWDPRFLEGQLPMAGQSDPDLSIFSAPEACNPSRFRSWRINLFFVFFFFNFIFDFLLLGGVSCRRRRDRDRSKHQNGSSQLDLCNSFNIVS